MKPIEAPKSSSSSWNEPTSVNVVEEEKKIIEINISSNVKQSAGSSSYFEPESLSDIMKDTIATRKHLKRPIYRASVDLVSPIQTRSSKAKLAAAAASTSSPTKARGAAAAAAVRPANSDIVDLI